MSETEPTPPPQRRLADLRVAELRVELERRGLELKGVKAVLLDRLQQAIVDEGKNPDEYILTPPAEKRTPTKRSSRSENLQELDSADETLDDSSTVTANLSLTEENNDKPPSVISESRNSVIKKREAEDSLESSESKKVCKESTPPPAEDNSLNNDFNGLDGDDSINIDIGDEDFLNEDGKQGTYGEKDESSEPQGAKDASCQNAGEEKQSVAEKQEVGADDSVQDDKKQETSPADETGNEDSKSISTEANPDKEKLEKDAKKSSASVASRNLWVSGLSRSTRATDLKQVCSIHGKVIGAKIVVNARSPGSRCYGYVTMSTPEDAQSCIKRLHKTELHGRIISVEKAKSETITGGTGNGRKESPARNNSQKRSFRSPRRVSGSRKKNEKGSQEKNIASSDKDAKEDDKAESTAEPKEGEDAKVVDKEKKDKDAVSGDDTKKKDGSQKGNDGQERRRSPRDYIPFEQIIRERDEHRASMRDWHNRHVPRRGIHKPLNHHHQDRQRMEMDRITIERKKLRIERERIEREKQELHRLERERQKLERVRLDVERLELKRAQMRLDEERGRAAAKRNYFMGPGGGGASGMMRSKDTMPVNSYDRSVGRGGGNNNMNTPRYNMPPPPFVNMSAPYNMSMGGNKSDRAPPPRDRRDFNRDFQSGPRHPGGGGGNPIKYSGNNASYEMRQPLPPGTRPRDPRVPGGNNHQSSRRSPKPSPRDHYTDSSVTVKGDSWSNNVGSSEGGNRYGGSITGSGPYGESRYASYQPAPPGIR